MWAGMMGTEEQRLPDREKGTDFCITRMNRRCREAGSGGHLR
jgi:hypothetical protein